MEGITLESVEEAFCEWRTQRSSRTDLIPKNLWSMALGLYPQNKRSIICRRLRLSGSQFKQRLESSRDTFVDNGFVYASRDVVKENPASNHDIHLTIQGQARSLTFCVDVRALGEILPHVGALL
jgi:hypothetical protein